MPIHKGLKRIRKQRKLSQQALVKDVKLVLKTYQQYEQGKVVPPADVIVKLASYYGVSCDYVMGLSDCISVENHIISETTGLSDTSITELQRIHAHVKEWDNYPDSSDKYEDEHNPNVIDSFKLSLVDSGKDEDMHKVIDCLNLIFSQKEAGILHDIYDYCTARVVIPKRVDLFDDNGSGHRIPATGLYRQYLLHQITAQLDNIAKKKAPE